MFLRVTKAVWLSLCEQSQVKVDLPATITSLQEQLKGELVLDASLWQRVGGGLGTQQVQFCEKTPAKV